MSEEPHGTAQVATPVTPITEGRVCVICWSLGGLVTKSESTQITSDTRTEKESQYLCALWDAFDGALGCHINSLANHPESTMQGVKLPTRRALGST